MQSTLTTTDTGIAPVAELAARILGEIRTSVIGKDETAELLLAAMLAGGHVLIEDVPGVGKTTLARAMAQAFGGTTRRIQFTPDLLPSDVTGITYFDQKAGRVPVPAGADLRQCGGGGRDQPRHAAHPVRAAGSDAGSAMSPSKGRRTRLPAPFLVVATQNPIELEGTFPLPEAQIDRFMMRLSMGYPGEARRGRHGDRRVRRGAHRWRRSARRKKSKPPAGPPSRSISHPRSRPI